MVGVIPAGSGNGFALHNGVKRNIKLAIKQLNNSKIKKVDSECKWKNICKCFWYWI